jgi:cell division protein FtsQ
VLENKKRYSIKNILVIAMWVVIGSGTVVLLVAAMRKKDEKRCVGIEINISGVSNNFFVDKKDILNSISVSEERNPVGKAIGSFNLKKMETELERNIWIKSAELFFDNNEILQVRVHEREPVARVFTSSGTTFYIDDELAILPLSEKFSARLPVFTNFPSDKKVLSKTDSILLKDIRTISLAIQKDSFRMAMIEQVDVAPGGVFEMIPKIGSQLIVFGDASNAEEKFNKLQLFYKEIMMKAGWTNYSVINVQYKNQVVAKRKGAEDISADSMRTLQIMKLIVERAQKQASDSLQVMQQDNEKNSVDINMIQQSIEREESAQPSNTYEKPKPQVDSGNAPFLKPTAPVVKTPAKQNLKTPVKPVIKKQAKAVMQQRNAN